MYKKLKGKLIILIFLIAIPTTMFLILMPTDVKANGSTEYIPEESSYNNWHWNVSEGDLLMYDIEMTAESSEGGITFKTMMIFNITGFQNATMNYMGDGQEMSIVNASMLYGDENGDLQIYNDEEPFAIFGYNETHPYHEKYNAPGGALIPVILPLNDSTVEVDVMAEILNETYIYPAYERGDISEFDQIGYDIIQNKIWIKNSIDGYFINLTYFDNGTLEEAIADYAFYEEDGLITINYKINRIFEYNLTDEIEWGVEAGETYYFGYAEGGEFNETKIDIVGFNNTIVKIDTLWGEMPLVFQDVIANVSLFNFDTFQYVLIEENMTIGSANNYYPFYIDLYGDNGDGEPSMPPFILPKNIKQEDLELFFNNETAQYLRFNTVYITKDGDLVSIEMIRDDSMIHSQYIFDNETGIVELYTLEGYFEEDERMEIVAFRKNSTTISDSTKTEELYSRLVDYATVYVNTSFSTPGSMDIYWAVLPCSPLGNYSIPYEIPSMPLYIDMYPEDPTLIDLFATNLTIIYDETKLGEIDEHMLNLYFFNFSSQKWEVQTNNTFDYNLNKIVANLSETFYYALGTNMTCLIEWSAGVGDELYVSEYGWLVRATVTMIEDYDIDFSEGGGPPILVGQPTIQQFSVIYADIHLWNGTDWEEDSEDSVIAAANNYWPVFIIEYYPFIFPMGTTGDDFKPLFNLIPGFDEKIYGDEFIYARNSTTGLATHINFTSSTGELLYYCLWFYDEDDDEWNNYGLYYGMNSTTLSPNTYEEYPLLFKLVNNWKLSMNITITEDADFFWALLPYNPTPYILDYALPDEIAFYFDVNTNNSEVIVWANFTIDYSSVDLAGNGIDPNDLVVYMFDLESEEWMLASDAIGLIIIRETGRLIIIMPTNTLFALGTRAPTTLPPSDGGGGGGGGGGGDKTAEIPGFDLYLLLGGIALFSVALIFKRKNYLK